MSANLDPKNLKKSPKAGVDEILDKFVAPEEIPGARRRITAGA